MRFFTAPFPRTSPAHAGISSEKGFVPALRSPLHNLPPVVSLLKDCTVNTSSNNVSTTGTLAATLLAGGHRVQRSAQLFLPGDTASVPVISSSGQHYHAVSIQRQGNAASPGVGKNSSNSDTGRGDANLSADDASSVEPPDR